MHETDELGRWTSLFMESTAVSSLAGADVGYGLACAATNYESKMEYRDGLDASYSAKSESM